MIKTVLCSAAVAVAIATPVWAQNQGGMLSQRAPILESLTDRAKEPAPKVEDFFAGQIPGQLLATDLMGLTVYGEGALALGTIDDVLFDENGKLSVVVVDVGALLNTEKRVAFALENLRYTMGKDDIRLVASLDRATIEAAPAFTSLADEMGLNDGQTITEEEGEPAPIDPAIPSN